jgi:spectinomycin phosphotransferase
MLALKERDLMFIGGGVGTVWNQPIESSYFYEGYGKTHINETMLFYYRNERIIQDIAEFTRDILSPELGNDVKLNSFNFFKSLFEPRGVIDIALYTFN